MKRSTESGLVKALLLRLGMVRGITAWRNNTTGVWDRERKRFRMLQSRKGVFDILGWIVCRRPVRVRKTSPIRKTSRIPRTSHQRHRDEKAPAAVDRSRVSDRISPTEAMRSAHGLSRRVP
jgi:hypothetical protein